MRSALVIGIAIGSLARPARAQSDSLPLIEVPARSAGGRTLAFLISGDGGWAGIDKDVSQGLAERGIAVVGLNARAYLATRRTPEEVAAAVATVLRRYLARWGLDRVALVGYSRGADIVPFIANRLPQDLRSRLDLVAMLGLGLHAGFHVSLFDLLHTTTNPSDPPTRPEVESLAKAGVRMLCVYGVEEKESLCRDAGDDLMIRIAKAGAHHFDGDHEALARAILEHLPPP